MSTIKEVAQRAGVSAATVSRVLNGSDCVREDTREQVERAIAQLQYVPNLQGRHLRRKETRRILVILNSLSNQFYSRVVRGIEDRARADGYTVVICATRDNRAVFLEQIEMLATKAVDGAILLFSELEGEELAALCEQHPIVCCSEPIPREISCSSVCIDNFRAGYDAMSYLLEGNRRNVAVISAGSYAYSSRMREDGCRAALIERGIRANDALFLAEGLTYRAGERAITHLLREKIQFDAVFAHSDSAAIGAIKTLAAHDIQIPRQVAVMGFDNTAISEMFLPPLTTVAQPQYELGTKAMELLIQRFGGAQPTRITLPHNIVTRVTA